MGLTKSAKVYHSQTKEPQRRDILNFYDMVKSISLKGFIYLNIFRYSFILYFNFKFTQFKVLLKGFEQGDELCFSSCDFSFHRSLSTFTTTSCLWLFGKNKVYLLVHTLGFIFITFPIKTIINWISMKPFKTGDLRRD